MFYVVVGDINAKEVEEQIRTAYAKAKARPMPSAPLVIEPKQVAPREIIEEATVELAHMHMSWHIPDVRHPDMPLIDVLATLLGNGRSSRLYQQVREKKGLASSVDAWNYTPGGAGIFGMSAMVEAAEFEAATTTLAELERMKSTLVKPEEPDQGRETVHRRHSLRAQDHGRPGTGSRRQLDGGERFELLQALPRRREAHHARRPAARRAHLSHHREPHHLRNC